MRKVLHTILLFIFLFFGLGMMSQPLPGQNGDGSSTGGDPIGGGANIGSGIAVLLALAAGYGLKKIYDNRRKLEE